MQIFTRTCDNTRKIALMLRNLGFGAIPIHGQMSQPKRLGAMNKFKAGERNILVATDVASRGEGLLHSASCCCTVTGAGDAGSTGGMLQAVQACRLWPATSSAAAARCSSLQAHVHACMSLI